MILSSNVVNSWRMGGQLPLTFAGAPAGNTGAQISNAATYHIDFLEVFFPSSRPSIIAGILGFTLPLWDFSDCDFYGYSGRHSFQSAHIYSGKLIDSGECCKLIMSGQALEYFKGFDRLDLLRRLLESGAHISRIDLALDDRSGLSSVGKVKTAIMRGNLVSHFRKCLTMSGFEIHSKEKTGKTIYLGSTSSERRIRIYDKALEQKTTDGLPWVRFELQARKDSAQNLAQLMCRNGGDIPELLRGVIDFRSCPEKQSDRRPVLSWWAELLCGACALRSGCKKGEDTIQRKALWIGRQCKKSLALTLGVLGPHYFVQILNDGINSINDKQWAFYESQYKLTSMDELNAAGLVPF